MVRFFFTSFDVNCGQRVNKFVVFVAAFLETCVFIFSELQISRLPVSVSMLIIVSWGKLCM